MRLSAEPFRLQIVIGLEPAAFLFLLDLRNRCISQKHLCEMLGFSFSFCSSAWSDTEKYDPERKGKGREGEGKGKAREGKQTKGNN